LGRLLDGKILEKRSTLEFDEGSDAYIYPPRWCPLLNKNINSIKNALADYGWSVLQMRDIDFKEMSTQFRSQRIEEKTVIGERFGSKNLEKYKGTTRLESILDVWVPEENKICFINPSYLVGRDGKLVNIYKKYATEKERYTRFYNDYIRDLAETDWIITADYND